MKYEFWLNVFQRSCTGCTSSSCCASHRTRRQPWRIGHTLWSWTSLRVRTENCWEWCCVLMLAMRTTWWQPWRWMKVMKMKHFHDDSDFEVDSDAAGSLITWVLAGRCGDGGRGHGIFHHRWVPTRGACFSACLCSYIQYHFCKRTYDHIAYVQTSFSAVYPCSHLVAGPSVVRLSLSDIRCLTKRWSLEPEVNMFCTVSIGLWCWNWDFFLVTFSRVGPFAGVVFLFLMHLAFLTKLCSRHQGTPTFTSVAMRMQRKREKKRMVVPLERRRNLCFACLFSCCYMLLRCVLWQNPDGSTWSLRHRKWSWCTPMRKSSAGNFCFWWVEMVENALNTWKCWRSALMNPNQMGSPRTNLI